MVRLFSNIIREKVLNIRIYGCYEQRHLRVGKIHQTNAIYGTYVTDTLYEMAIFMVFSN